MLPWAARKTGRRESSEPQFGLLRHGLPLLRPLRHSFRRHLTSSVPVATASISCRPPPSLGKTSASFAPHSKSLNAECPASKDRASHKRAGPHTFHKRIDHRHYVAFRSPSSRHYRTEIPENPMSEHAAAGLRDTVSRVSQPHRVATRREIVLAVFSVVQKVSRKNSGTLCRARQPSDTPHLRELSGPHGRP